MSKSPEHLCSITFSVLQARGQIKCKENFGGFFGIDCTIGPNHVMSTTQNSFFSPQRDLTTFLLWCVVYMMHDDFAILLLFSLSGSKVRVNMSAWNLRLFAVLLLDSALASSAIVGQEHICKPLLGEQWVREWNDRWILIFSQESGHVRPAHLLFYLHQRCLSFDSEVQSPSLSRSAISLPSVRRSEEKISWLSGPISASLVCVLFGFMFACQMKRA